MSGRSRGRAEQRAVRCGVAQAQGKGTHAVVPGTPGCGSLKSQQGGKHEVRRHGQEGSAFQGRTACVVDGVNRGFQFGWEEGDKVFQVARVADAGCRAVFSGRQGRQLPCAFFSTGRGVPGCAAAATAARATRAAAALGRHGGSQRQTQQEGAEVHHWLWKGGGRQRRWVTKSGEERHREREGVRGSVCQRERQSDRKFE